jgi:predicted metalloprotease with PDZ domain
MMLLWALSCASAPTPAPPVGPDEPIPTASPGRVEHTVRVLDPARPYFHVRSVFEAAPDQGPLELRMAVWTPGSYLVREYAGQVTGLSAEGLDGPLTATKTTKNRWQIHPGGSHTVVVSYRVHAHDLTVRTNFVDPDFALLNGAAVFLDPVGLDAAHGVAFGLPSGWTSTMALPPHPSGQADHYLAPSYDALVDAPAVLGTPTTTSLEVTGVPHTLVDAGDVDRWDSAEAAEDAAKVVQAAIEFWGEVPYPSYTLLNLVAEGSGGLEHSDSTVLLTSRWRRDTEDGRRGWASLVAHEHFHAWNGKRLRPRPLGPFDYEGEVHTPDLWVVEGLTSYYADLLVLRSGLSDADEFLKALSKRIDKVESGPGKLEQGLSASSWDAWIKAYRKTEDSPNTTVSYYGKGAVVGFLLDAKIRQHSGGARSLDDAMRLAYQRWSGEQGYTPEDFRALLSEVAGTDLGPWLVAAVDTTEPLPYDDALTWYGLKRVDPPEETDDTPDPWFGLTVSGSNKITAIRADGPGAHAALSVGDELVGLDGYRIGSWDSASGRATVGEPSSLLVSRRGKLTTTSITPTRAAQPWALERDPEASQDAASHLEAWLGAPDEAE